MELMRAPGRVDPHILQRSRMLWDVAPERVVDLAQSAETVPLAAQVPQKVDLLVSEPIGTFLFNERRLGAQPPPSRWRGLPVVAPPHRSPCPLPSAFCFDPFCSSLALGGLLPPLLPFSSSSVPQAVALSALGGPSEASGFRSPRRGIVSCSLCR